MEPTLRSPPEIRAAQDLEQAAALAWLLTGRREAAHEPLVQETRAAAEAGQVSLSGLLVAVRDTSMVGACWGFPLPGKVASVYAPRLDRDEPDDLGVALLARVHQQLASEARLLAQALCTMAEVREMALLETAGYWRAARLHYLTCELAAVPIEAPSSEWTFSPCQDDQRERMARLVERTYEGTLDCPDLNGLRAMEDVLEGYQATGAWSPERWLFAQRSGEDVGCLLLASHPALGQWELAYMGLVPEARGRGWGRGLVEHAQRLAKAAGASRMIVGVDAANDPALRIYAKCGFWPCDERLVYFCWIEPLMKR